MKKSYLYQRIHKRLLNEASFLFLIVYQDYLGYSSQRTKKKNIKASLKDFSKKEFLLIIVYDNLYI